LADKQSLVWGYCSWICLVNCTTGSLQSKVPQHPIHRKAAGVSQKCRESPCFASCLMAHILPRAQRCERHQLVITIWSAVTSSMTSGSSGMSGSPSVSVSSRTLAPSLKSNAKPVNKPDNKASSPKAPYKFARNNSCITGHNAAFTGTFK